MVKPKAMRPVIVGIVVGAVAAVIAATGSCLRSTEELSATVNTRIFVVGLPTDAVVQIEVAGQRRQFSPTGNFADPGAAGTELLDDDIVEFQLSLPAGNHPGKTTTYMRHDAVLLRDLCGSFLVELPGVTAMDTDVIAVEDLSACEGDDEDDSSDDDTRDDDDLIGGGGNDDDDHSGDSSGGDSSGGSGDSGSGDSGSGDSSGSSDDTAAGEGEGEGGDA